MRDETRSPPPELPDLLEVSRRLNREAAAGRTDFDPPAGKAQIYLVVHALSPAVGGEIVNYPDMYSEPPCPECHLPRGTRTTQSLRIWTADVTTRGAHALMAQLDSRPLGPTFHVFSAELLARLTPEERAAFEWRIVERYRGHNRKELYEITASAIHAPFVELRGGNADRLECATCGARGPADYPLPGCLPAWLHPFEDFKRRGQPYNYVSAADLPDPVPSCFTVGDWRTGVTLAFLQERWTQVNHQASVTSVGVMDPELVHCAA